MSYGIKLRVWGERACFTRPEMKVERVSYDVMTPSAARGILEAIHWKPAIRWVVKSIHVLKPICFESIRRNEVSSKIPVGNIKKAMNAGSTRGLKLFIEDLRQQRAATVLRDVDYVIEARLEMTRQAQADDNKGKHYQMFMRRADRGQCHHQPYLGCREFAAYFCGLDEDAALPATAIANDQRDRDLGWMLYDIDYSDGMNPMFFRAWMKNGIVSVPSISDEGVKA